MQSTNYRRPVRNWPRKAGLHRVLAVVLMLAGGATNMSAQAADGTNVLSKGLLQAAGGNGKTKGKSKPIISERPQVIGRVQAPSGGSDGKPVRPGADVSETAQIINHFQTAREDYLTAQKELRLKSATATEEQRALLREKSREALDKWQVDHRMYVEEQKERARQMKQELSADIGRAVDGAGEGAGSGRGR